MTRRTLSQCLYAIDCSAVYSRVAPDTTVGKLAALVGCIVGCPFSSLATAVVSGALTVIPGDYSLSRVKISSSKRIPIVLRSHLLFIHYKTWSLH